MFRLVTYIRKLSLGVLFIVCIAITESYAGDATLSWTASKDSNVAGYKLYYGTVSHSYTSSINVGLQTTTTVTGLNAGVYYFAVTAYNSAGAESGFSNEASLKQLMFMIFNEDFLFCNCPAVPNFSSQWNLPTI